MAQESIAQFRTIVTRSSVTRPANTTAYATGDVVADATADAYFTFGTSGDSSENSEKVARVQVDTATINGIRLHSSANQTPKLAANLWLFKAAPTAIADNAALALTDAEALTVVAVIPIALTDWVAGNSASGASGNAVALVDNIDIPVVTSTGGRLFGMLVAADAYTPVSGEVFTIDLISTQD